MSHKWDFGFWFTGNSKSVTEFTSGHIDPTGFRSKNWLDGSYIVEKPLSKLYKSKKMWSCAKSVEK